MTSAAKAVRMDQSAEAIATEIRATDITALGLWADLDSLSSRTLLEGIDVDPEWIVVNPDQSFDGVFNIFVTLNYGSGKEAFSTSDSFLGRFSGRLIDGRPVIETSAVNTSSFRN